MKNRLKSMEYVFNRDSYSNVRFCCLTYISHEKFRLDKVMEMKKTGFYCSLFINICFILKKNINNDPRKNRLKSKQLLTKLSNLDKWPLPLCRLSSDLFRLHREILRNLCFEDSERQDQWFDNYTICFYKQHQAKICKTNKQKLSCTLRRNFC